MESGGKDTPADGASWHGQKKSKKKLRKQKSPRPFDMSRFEQRQIVLKILYFGEEYCGFAAQENRDNTIEQRLFEALLKTKLITSRAESNYSRSGRTDKGVSAYGQVVSLLLRSSRRVDAKLGAASGAEMDYCMVLNRALPSDIRVTAWAPAPRACTRGSLSEPVRERIAIAALEGAGAEGREGAHAEVPKLQFSARFSTSARTYRYFFVRRQLCLRSMATAAKSFEGTHDFRNFCKMDAVNVSNYVRTMLYVRIQVQVEPHMPTSDSTSADNISNEHGTNSGTTATDAITSSPSSWRTIDDALAYEHADVSARAVCRIEVKGQAFLWHQIRCMAAVLFLVGAGREHPSVVESMLDISSMPRKPQYELASELPLVLHECSYSGSNHEPLGSGEDECDNDALFGLSAGANTVRGSANNGIGHAADVSDQLTSPTTTASASPSLGSLDRVCSELEQRWEVSVLRAALARNALDATLARRARVAATVAAGDAGSVATCGTDSVASERASCARLMQLHRSGLHARGGKHTPLCTRSTSASYDERVSGMTGAKLQRHRRHTELRQAAIAEVRRANTSCHASGDDAGTSTSAASTTTTAEASSSSKKRKR